MQYFNIKPVQQIHIKVIVEPYTKNWYTHSHHSVEIKKVGLMLCF